MLHLNREFPLELNFKTLKYIILQSIFTNASYALIVRTHIRNIKFLKIIFMYCIHTLTL